MASVNWQKQTAQIAGAMRCHFNQQERLTVEHSNPDIDKSKSDLNYCIGCSDYQECYKKMRKRVAEVDKESPPERVTKDRKICCSFEAPCPQEIYDSGRQREFFEKLHEVYCDFFGKENCHGSCVHLDEIHEYTDAKTGEQKMSLAHSTELVSCYVEWHDKKHDKDRKGINGKNFETKARIKNLNAAVCDMVRREFGVEYNTGEDAQRKSVEKLKAETEISALEKEQNRREQFLQYLQREREERERQLATLDAEVEDKLEVSDELSHLIALKQNELDELYDTIDALEQNAAEWEQYNDSLYMQHKTTTEVWKKRIDAAASIEKWRDKDESTVDKGQQNDSVRAKQVQFGRSE